MDKKKTFSEFQKKWRNPPLQIKKNTYYSSGSAQLDVAPGLLEIYEKVFNKHHQRKLIMSRASLCISKEVSQGVNETARSIAPSL